MEEEHIVRMCSRASADEPQAEPSKMCWILDRPQPRELALDGCQNYGAHDEALTFAALKEHFQAEMANHLEIFGSAAEKDTSFADYAEDVQAFVASGSIDEFRKQFKP